jgi:DNA-binding response OmpR family regulator
MPVYKVLFLNNKADSATPKRQILPVERDDSSRVIVVETAPMLAPLLADRLREDGLRVESEPSLARALDLPELLAVIIATPEAWDFKDKLKGSAIPTLIALAQPGAAAIDGVSVTLERPARLEALVTILRAAPRTRSTLEIGLLTLDAKTRRLSDRSGMERARLTEKEAEILSALLRSPSREVTREALLRDVWRYHDAVQSHTMETHIYRLRRKLIEAEPSLAGAIETIAGGYRLRLERQA